MGEIDRERTVQLLPGDEVLLSISNMMDKVLKTTGATGVLLGSIDRSALRVEISRSSPLVFKPGDRLIRFNTNLHTVDIRSKREGSPETRPDRERRSGHREQRTLESEHFTFGPVKEQFILEMGGLEIQRVLTMYSTRQLAVEPDVALGMLEMLKSHIELAFSLRTEVSEVNRALDDAESRASLDPMTKVLNRHGFEMAVIKEQRRRSRYQLPVTVVIFDLDGLKAINDRSGHKAGDEYIMRFARVLSTATRGIDSVCRLGGDEFAILAPQSGALAAEGMIERYRKLFQEAGVSVSIGIATDDVGDVAITDLLALADARMYADKATRSLARSGAHSQAI